MIKRYGFPSKEKAKELIADLELNGKTVNALVSGIVELDFQHKYEFNEITEESILIEEATTYDVDVYWKNNQPTEWEQYEINPFTPNHKFQIK